MNFEVDPLGCYECVIDPRDLQMTRNAYYSLERRTKQLLLMSFCATPAESDKKIKCDVWTDTCTYKWSDIFEV